MKDADREKKVAIGRTEEDKARIRMAIKRQISSFSLRGLIAPHQGKREIERRRRQIAAGKLNEKNGLIMADSRPIDLGPLNPGREEN